jgi:2-dehydro-3-deoxyphosphogalactonate aldolase
MNHPPTLVAILRGLEPAHAVGVAETLYEAGVRCIEVPLNSPQPFESIANIAKRALPGVTLGAGTVLSAADVARTRDAGGSLIVSPNCDAEVIRSALKQGMRAMPGFATATEMFQAIGAGATELKLFPAASLGTDYLQALGAVLSAGIRIYPVGGVTGAQIPAWLKAGARGFGFGSELFKPDYSLADIKARARELVQALETEQRR